MEEYWQETQKPEPQEEEKPSFPTAFSLAYHRGHTLDPITGGEGVQQEIGNLLYEPLFRLDGTFSPVPVLCADWRWEEDGLGCILTLQQEAVFSDGTALTAADVVETLQRAAASNRYAYRLRNVASISANREGQVVLRLTVPNRGLPALLDIPIVKRGTGSQTVPLGTGPYVFQEDASGAYLQVREDWWQNHTLPLSRIPLVNAKNRGGALYLFSTHRTELMTVNAAESRDYGAGDVEETLQPSMQLQYVGFNTAEGRVFASAAARRAFFQGIPRERLVSSMLSGWARAAQFPVSPLSELYPASLEQPYSLENTIALLIAAGQNTGETKELVFLVNAEDSFRVASARFIAENLSQLDWSIVVTALPWAEYMAALQAGEFDLYYGETRLTADWDIAGLVGSGGWMNYGGYTNELMDGRILQLAESEDRTEAVKRLCALLAADAPIAPVCFTEYIVLTHPGVVKGLAPTLGNAFAGMEEWRVCLAE